MLTSKFTKKGLLFVNLAFIMYLLAYYFHCILELQWTGQDQNIFKSIQTIWIQKSVSDWQTHAHTVFHRLMKYNSVNVYNIIAIMWSSEHLVQILLKGIFLCQSFEIVFELWTSIQQSSAVHNTPLDENNCKMCDT